MMRQDGLERANQGTEEKSLHTKVLTNVNRGIFPPHSVDDMNVEPVLS